MGTPDFAATILSALIEAGPPYPRRLHAAAAPGRTRSSPAPSPVQELAERHGLPVHCPASLRDPAAQAEFAAIPPTPPSSSPMGCCCRMPVLNAPRLGCINVHASLLPRWRGAAPIQRAILAGDAETGITIMQMDEGSIPARSCCSRRSRSAPKDDRRRSSTSGSPRSARG